MTPQQTQHIGPEQKKQIEQQLDKMQHAITLKQNQINMKTERAQLYDRLHDLMIDDTGDDEDTAKIEEAWATIYALEASTALNDAELLKLDLGDMEAMVTQLETVLRAIGSGIVVATAQVPHGITNKHR